MLCYFRRLNGSIGLMYFFAGYVIQLVVLSHSKLGQGAVDTIYV